MNFPYLFFSFGFLATLGFCPESHRLFAAETKDLPGTDTIPPAAISKLKAVTGNGRLVLSWENPADADFHGIKLTIQSKNKTKRDTILQPALTEFTFIRGNNLQTCSFIFRAVDTSGNESEKTQISACCLITDLPVLNLRTRNRQPLSMKKIRTDGTLTITNADQEVCLEDIPLTLRRRGNVTLRNPKPSLALTLKNANGMLGMKRHKRWILLANYNDKTLLRNDLALHLGREVFDKMGWNPDFRHVQLVLNNEYLGEYLLTEQIEIGKDRVDIASIAGSHSGGYILAADNHYDNPYHFTTKQGVSFQLKDPDKDGGLFDERAFNEIKTRIQAVEDSIYSEHFPGKGHEYRKMIDAASFIDWYLVNEITKNNDAILWASCYMYYDPSDTKIHMGPLWDFDISCGNINYNGCDADTGFWIMKAPWIKQLFTDPDFVSEVKKRWKSKKPLLDPGISEYISRQALFLDNAQKLNFSRWPVLGKNIWPNAKGFEDRKTYQSEIDYLRNFLIRRIRWLDDAFERL